MKMIFVVYVIERHGKYAAISDTIKAGENLTVHCTRYDASVCHLCKSRREADRLALAWNSAYTANGTHLFCD